MPTGVYTRTKKHRKINSVGHKRYWETHTMDVETRRKISVSLMISAICDKPIDMF